MKHVGSLISKLAAYGVTLVVTALVATAQAGNDTAKVMTVRGSAQYATAGGAWMPLKVGASLDAGTTVKTAANSEVDLYLKVNGPVIRITADTTLALKKLFFDDTGADVVIDTQLDLTNGRILGNVKKMAAASKYDVKVPTGTVGIRGTEYDISTTGAVTVLTGSVLVTYVSPAGVATQVTVNAGQTWNPPTTAEGPVSAPIPTPAETTTNITGQFKDIVTVIPPSDTTGPGVIIVQPKPEPPTYVSPVEGQSQ